MIEDLKRIGLSAIDDIQDLGYFGWRPQDPHKDIHQLTADELRYGTNFQRKPCLVQPIESLQRDCPKAFYANEDEEPHKVQQPSHIIALFVAIANRGVNIENIDFVFGGSVLHMLATSKIRNEENYSAQQIPGTRVVVVEKKHSYITNSNDFGHQFERFVLGKSITQETVIHIQIMKLGDCQVLVAAETDGMDQEERPVEIKSSNPKNWGIKVALQMISNGSYSLYSGSKVHTMLVDVHHISLFEVLQRAFAKQSTRRRTNVNILSGIQALKQASSHFENPHKIHFESEKKQMTFHPVSSFPYKEETLKLLNASSSKTLTDYGKILDDTII